ncbi:lysozyme [Acetobacter persici]|uniref:lysozyme n=1 Tax=Acetobacter persici TaxID=1076596 RepID=UPI001BA63FF7|nr:lysozyme [Acetobacter persici]MBS1015208.1 lysozyme [Acetobacter persici]
MNDSISIAAGLAREYEGLRLKPYICPAGYWTIGYGNRCLANGSAVTRLTPAITAVQAEALLMLTLAGLRYKLRQLVHVALTPNKEGALLDWQFNLGTSAIAGSTLLRLLNSGQDIAAGEQLLLWNHAHKDGHLITLPGLTNRRHAEWLIYTGATSGHVPAASPSPSTPPTTTTTDQLNRNELARVKAIV